MKTKPREKSSHLTQAARTLAVVLTAAVSLSLAPCSSAQNSVWSEAVNVSNTLASSWFPSLAVDSIGRVHVVWTENSFDAQHGLATDSLLYAVWDGESWSKPNDLYTSTQADAYTLRPAIVADRADTVHLLYRYPTVIYHMRAPAQSAWSVQSWTASHRLSGHGNSNWTDIAIDSQGVLHAVWSEEVVYDLSDGEGHLTSDVFYRHSVDGGRTWSSPRNLSRSESPVGNSLHIHIDTQDTIHVVWDEAQSCGYTSSPDGGRSWSQRTAFQSYKGTPHQIVAGVDGNGKILVAWRTVPADGSVEHLSMYYQLSPDGGFSWSEPAAIPELLARGINETSFDAYDMAVDSAGHLHLVVVGRTNFLEIPLSVLHTEWDGYAWSSPTRIFNTTDFPERPVITISRGNQLHVAWFVRAKEDLYKGGGDYQVWYSRAQSAAPSVLPPASPTPLPTPTTTPTSVPWPSPTPYPTLATGASKLPSGLYTESDEILQLILALLPLAFLVLLITIVRRRRL